MKGWPPREKCWTCSNGTIFKYYYIRTYPLIPEGVDIWEYEEAKDTAELRKSANKAL
jgi:hypothetical protein